MTSPSPTVSVIVTTIGRPELGRALQSVRRQDTPEPVELVVVVDRPAEQGPPGPEPLPADVIVYTGGGHGASHARNAGVDVASGAFVAFLDDDDEWRPEKLRCQLELIATSRLRERAVVSSRVVHVAPTSDRVSRPVPDRLIGPQQSVGHYLFRRRPPTTGRASMYTSTLLCARDLALEVRWDPSLRRHQDWDWLIRLERAADVHFLQAPEALVRIQTGSTGSMSASLDWRSSLDWATNAFRDDPLVQADFVAAQPLRYALGARSWRGTVDVVRRLRALRRWPAPGPLILGIGGLIPRRSIEQLMLRSRGSERSR